MLKELGFPREIRVAPGAETSDREAIVHTHAPHVIRDSVRERLDASGVTAPPLECVPSHGDIFAETASALLPRMFGSMSRTALHDGLRRTDTGYRRAEEVRLAMAWAERLVASLDRRATLLATARGDVQVARDGHGAPVMAVHGGPGGFDLGLAWCRHLREGGCELLAPSRPGYLRTPLQSGRTPEEQADLYAAVLDALRIERVVIFGFSSGGPSAVHFAARHPERTTALYLDAAILLPFEPPIGKLRQATYESSLPVWLSCQVATRRPELAARFMVGGVSSGLTTDQARAAAGWITGDPTRLRMMQDQWTSSAPPKYRKPGWDNDKINERDLAPLPFADVTAPTLIAHGANDAIVPIRHATNAADQIDGAQLIVVEQGHHLLSLCPRYQLVGKRQLELAHAQPTP